MAWRLAGRRLALNYEKIDDALTAAGGPLPIRLIPILLKTQQLGNQHERADEEIATLELLLARLRETIRDGGVSDRADVPTPHES